MKPKLIFFLLFTFNLLLVASATIRYVSKTGSSTPPYTSWATASDSIQKCINISQNGDTVYVGKGTYIELVRMLNGLALIGAGWDSCVIDTRSISSPTNFYSVNLRDSSIIEGFNIIVRNNMEGVGIRCFPGTNDPLYFYGEIRNNKISLAGHGILTNNAFLTIKNNFIEICDRGIRVDALDSSVLDSIYENYLFNIRSTGISTGLGCRAVIFNNFVQMDNNLARGIGIASWAPSKVYSNIITNLKLGGLGFDAGSLPTEVINNLSYHFDVGIDLYYTYLVRNNIVQKNNSGFRNLDSTPPNVKYNNTWNNNINYYGFVPDSTNLTVDPMLVNEDSSDFHLQMYSPLIDAGDPNILDRDGSRSDIGLFGGPYGEKYTYRDLAPKPPKNLTAQMENGFVRLRWNKNTEADFSYYRIYRDTVPHFIYDTTKIVGVTSDTAYLDHLPVTTTSKKYYYLLTAMDSTNHQSAPSEEVMVMVTGLNEIPPIVVEEYKLLNNYPNPFNSSTLIPYRLKEGGYVKLIIYNVMGEVVRVLVNEYQPGGYYEAEFRPNTSERKMGAIGVEFPTGYNDDIASGLYIYSLNVRGEGDIPVFNSMGKMILLK